MAKKKNRKRSSGSGATYKKDRDLQNPADEKRMKPMARNMLLLAVVVLVGSIMLERAGMGSPMIEVVACIVGLGLTVLALLVQYNILDTDKKPRL